MAAAVCHLSLGAKADTNAEGGATLPSTQAEHIAGQRQRQHRQHAIRQIQTCGATLRFPIKRAPRSNQAAGIGNVNPDPRTVLLPHQCQTVIDLPGSGIVQGVDGLIGEIEPVLISAAGQLRPFHQAGGFLLQSIREVR